MIDTKTKLAGILVPVFALRRDNDLGIGDTKATIDAIDFCARNSCAVLQVLPINETGGDNSPYNAISSVALDPVLLTLTPDMVPGLTDEILNRHAPETVKSQLQKGAVNYGQVKKVKYDLLRDAFENFRKNDLGGSGSKNSAQGEEFRKFQKEQAAWLTNYTLFRTLVDLNGGNTAWPRWIEDQRTPEKAEKWAKNNNPEAKRIEDTRELFAYIQWIAYSQWNAVRKYADERGIGLMGDIPFGVSRYSADVWAHQDLFDLDWSGGAPPETWFKDDKFTAKWGQNWGLPIYEWGHHRQQKFAWWRQRVQKCVEIFHYFRIDHVLGFFRIYSFPWIPERNGEFLNLTEEQAKKKTGGRLPQFLPRSDEEEEWAEQNAADGRALLEMVLDAAGKHGVVAEDLGGMVPDYVHPTLQELKIPGFTIPYWTRTEDQELVPKEELPEISLATYATHDHQPLKVYYEEMVKRWHSDEEGPAGWLDVQRLMRWLELDEENPPAKFTPQLHQAFTKSLLETPCWLAVFMITDLLGTTERFNQPGTSGESNWSRRLDMPLSGYETNAPFCERLQDFRKLVNETGRLPRTVQVGTIR